jgi:hypothetical protein
MKNTKHLIRDSRLPVRDLKPNTDNVSTNRGTVSNIHQDGMCVVLLYLLQLQVGDSRGDETGALLKADNLQVDKMFGVF